MSGARTIESLKQAIAGDFARVTVDGQTWIRLEKHDPNDGPCPLCGFQVVRKAPVPFRFDDLE